MIPPLWIVTDDSIAPERMLDVWPAIVRALPTGMVALSVRNRVLDAGPLLSLVKKLATNGNVVVSRRVDIAHAAGVGVHLPENGIPASDARKLLGAATTIIQAMHPPGLAATDASAALVGPVFKPKSHASDRTPMGLDGIAECTRQLSVPVIALGGIDASNVNRVRDAGCAGFAVVSAIWAADDPVVAARELLNAWNGRT